MKWKNLSKPHLEEAFILWQQGVHRGDTVVDATCGNGRDTLALARLALTEETGRVYALDIQQEAVHKAKAFVHEQLGDLLSQRVVWFVQSHTSFPYQIEPESLSLVTYNLGYLPGGNKSIITRAESTLTSLFAALPLLKKRGIITLISYPGHPGGATEEETLLKAVKTLDKKQFLISHTAWINRNNHPSLIKVVKL